MNRYGKKLFLHIPRTGGLSVIDTMQDQTLHIEGIGKRYEVPWEDYWIFTIVRHPLDRLVSLCGYVLRPPYNGRVLTPEMFHAWVKGGMLDRDGGQYTVYSTQPYAFDLCTPQMDCLDGVPINKTFRFERLEDLELDLPHLNSTGRLPWEAYYTDAEVLDLAMRRYAKDFQLGYDLPEV